MARELQRMLRLVLELRDVDPPNVQLAVFRIEVFLRIALAGENGIEPRQLMADTGTTATTIHRNIGELRDNYGLIGEHPHPEDGRVKVYKLTPAGRRKIERFIAIFRAS